MLLRLVPGRKDFPLRQLATLGLAQARTNKKKFDLASWLFL